MHKEKNKAFSVEYGNITVELLTEVELFNPANTNLKFKTTALWDTGAVISCISPGVLEKLLLKPIDSIEIEVVNSTERCDMVLVQVGLPNGIMIPNIKPAVCHFGPKDVEFIIGMDIIRYGDLMISNSFDKTLFSFCIPPLPRKIDLTKEAYA